MKSGRVPDSDRAFIREGLRSCLSSPRSTFLVAFSIFAFVGLFLVSWFIFMPVSALLVAPATVAVSFLFGSAPAPLPNTLAAIALSATLAGATVTAAFRVLLRRARARQRSLTASAPDGA